MEVPNGGCANGTALGVGACIAPAGRGSGRSDGAAGGRADGARVWRRRAAACGRAGRNHVGGNGDHAFCDQQCGWALYADLPGWGRPLPDADHVRGHGGCGAGRDAGGRRGVAADERDDGAAADRAAGARGDGAAYAVAPRRRGRAEHDVPRGPVGQVAAAGSGSDDAGAAGRRCDGHLARLHHRVDGFFGGWHERSAEPDHAGRDDRRRGHGGAGAGGARGPGDDEHVRRLAGRLCGRRGGDDDGAGQPPFIGSGELPVGQRCPAVRGDADDEYVYAAEHRRLVGRAATAQPGLLQRDVPTSAQRESAVRAGGWGSTRGQSIGRRCGFDRALPVRAGANVRDPHSGPDGCVPPAYR